MDKGSSKPEAGAPATGNPADSAAYPPLTLPEMVFASAAAAPAAPLIDFLGRRYTYAQVTAEAQRFAAGLQAAGVVKGDRVALCLPNVPLYLSAYYGALLAGACVVNCAPTWSADALAERLADTRPKVLVTLDVAAVLDPVRAARSAVETVVVGRLSAMLPPLSGALHRLIGRAAPIDGPGMVGWRDFLRAEAPAPVALDAVRDVAVIQYTNGTTGAPKAVRLSHQNLTVNARQLEAIDPWHGARDVMLGVLPLAGIFANSAVLNRTVLDRGCIALLPRFDARQVLRTVARTRATVMPGVPAMFQALLDSPELERTDLSSLRACISGGAPLPAPLKRRFEAASQARLVEGYGLAEAAGVVSVNPLGAPERPGTVGVPLPGTRWQVFDLDDPSRPAAPGEAGELAVAGAQVMLGYWDDPAADARALDGEWLRTGDLATIDAAGYATVIDRLADAIDVAGTRVFPSRIEAILLGHDSVREAVAIGVPDAFRGESPKVYATLRGEALDTGESLRNWLNGRLPREMRVLAVEVRETLPRIPVGKLDRNALRAEEAARGIEFSRAAPLPGTAAG
jgi:long-chain acyl-CoA synthetase